MCRVNSPQSECNEIVSDEASLHVNSQHTHLPEPATPQGIEQEAKPEQAAVPEADAAQVARKQASAKKKLASSLTKHALEPYSFLDCFMLLNTCNALCAKQ